MRAAFWDPFQKELVQERFSVLFDCCLTRPFLQSSVLSMGVGGIWKTSPTQKIVGAWRSQLLTYRLQWGLSLLLPLSGLQYCVSYLLRANVQSL